MGRRLFIPNPFCVRPAPMMRIEAFGEIFVCCRDQFADGPRRRGFTLDSTSASSSPWDSSDSRIARVDFAATVA